MRPDVFPSDAARCRVSMGRGASVLVCGSLQRFQRSGVEEKRYDTYEGDAVAVGPGLFVWIAGHNDLPEVVADVTERGLAGACRPPAAVREGAQHNQ